MTPTSPRRDEAAEYYFIYIDQVGSGDIRDLLETQGTDTLAELGAITEEQSLQRYAPDKWTLRGVLGHLNDTERMMMSRAFWFARGFDSPLPSFDQHIAMTASGADQRSWRSHLDEFRAVRAATETFFRNLPDDAWDRRGIASDNPFTVRALAYLVVGHVTHHMRIVRERYLGQSSA
jgi:hypothetical protein